MRSPGEKGEVGGYAKLGKHDMKYIHVLFFCGVEVVSLVVIVYARRCGAKRAVIARIKPDTVAIIPAAETEAAAPIHMGP
ncbi:hypothetical protein PEV8663_02701 [Pelagimonas varians]|uniref:Uncharacterized protein n=1 Tax=Pelagimonas varians TaxID=696760 RepID=A0A238KLC2_9RHOB|nr:hypothetical protein PEV8663_02701 [Pelagimonas varians]